MKCSSLYHPIKTSRATDRVLQLALADGVTNPRQCSNQYLSWDMADTAWLLPKGQDTVQTCIGRVDGIAAQPAGDLPLRVTVVRARIPRHNPTNI